MSEIESKVNRIIENASGNHIDIFYTLCEECLSDKETCGANLKSILMYPEIIGDTSAGSPTMVGEEYVKSATKKYFPLLQETVQAIVMENLPEDDFYNKLANIVFISPDLFPKDKSGQAVLLYLLVEKIQVLPYFQVSSPLIMDEADFRSAMQRIKPQMQKAFFMLNRNFDSYTEMLSQLYRIGDEIEERNDRIVYCAAICIYFQKIGEFKAKQAQKSKET